MTKRSNQSKGPQFVEYMGPVLEALQELGGSGRPIEVIDLIASKYDIPDELNEEIASGGTRFSKNVHWARFYLAKDEYIDSSQRGVWNLTKKGRDASLSHREALAVFQRVHKNFKEQQDVETVGDMPAQANVDDEIGDETSILDGLSHRSSLLSMLRNLSPSGFERFCQRLLREAGFEQVKVTGRSGDGGIDGQGILKINQFVSFQVAFQSKRYAHTNSLGPEVVRDFRGAIMGRADKGIIITTGAFTSQARQEAIRDGATPIELVDGEQIIDMMEELDLGLEKKRTITLYEIDEDFFEEFR